MPVRIGGIAVSFFVCSVPADKLLLKKACFVHGYILPVNVNIHII